MCDGKGSIGATRRRRAREINATQEIKYSILQEMEMEDTGKQR
jgi:hypothetical protein